MNEPTNTPHAGQPTDPLSILSLAAGIASLVLAVFSVLPLAGMCLMPIAALSMLVALVSGVASIVRTTLNPQLQGRAQAIAGVLMAITWCGVATLLFMFIARHD